MRMIHLLFALVLFSAMAFGQVVTIDNFENLRPDTLYATSKGGSTVQVITADITNKVEGAAALKLWSVLKPSGTWSQIGYSNQTKLLNWGTGESLSVWINVTKAPKTPANMNFRLQVSDNIGGVTETWIYQQNTILDAAKGWVNLRFPLTGRMPADGSLPPDSTGFSISPSIWGFSTNNKQFDADKIGSWYFTAVTAAAPDDSLEILFDRFEQVGSKAVPVTIYDGVKFTGVVIDGPWAWGAGTAVIEKGTGSGGAQTNAIKWTQGAGWTGWGTTMSPQNMVGAWTKDSLKIKIKADTGTGALRIQLEGGGGKVGKVFQPKTDNKWNSYVFAIKDLVYQDGKTSIDSVRINVFGLMAENSGKAGKVLYVSDIWTGNPTFDVIPPLAPTGVIAFGGVFTNAVTWNDVPNEAGATYNVYFNEKPFTAIDEKNVEDLPPYKIASGITASSHILRYPLVDQNITYYYGVTASDKSGNIGALGVSPAVTTKAKGVATIALAPPANITIDGDIKEWAASTIKPVVISTVPAIGEGHVEGGKVDGDVDLKVTSYMATDANNLYLAFDVDDDVVSGDTTIYVKGTYGVDGCDLFLGLYDWRGARHKGYAKGATPDYHFRFTKFGAVLDNNGKYLNRGAGLYKFTEKILTSGYIIEAKFPFKMLADSLGAGTTVFTPVDGMRIPLDYSINDNDGKNPTGQPWEAREGIICYSQFNNDNSWQDMWKWSHTWVGKKWITSVQRNDGIVAKSFELSQNYPNPFNPTTNIRYSVPKAGVVSLKVFDVLGREVMSVLNQYQDAGSYTASLDGSKLATGMYVYRLESGSFSSTKKMMLLK